jgi:hypothetical protein
VRESIEEPLRDLEGVSAIGSHGTVAAVVEKDVGAYAMLTRAEQSLVDAGVDSLGAEGLPVPAHSVPLDELEAELGGGVKDCWAARSVRRTQIVDRRSERVFEGLIAGMELITNDVGRLKAEPRMRVRVIADEVAGGVNATGDFWPLPDESAHHEERGSGVMAGEDIEELVSGGIVGTVVVGERDFVGIAARDDGSAEELRTWTEGCVRKGAGRGCYERGCGDRGCCARHGITRDARGDHNYFLRSARTSSAWPSGLTLLNSWMSRWSGPMT